MGKISYDCGMRGLVRRLLIGLLALSFAASGVAARQCDAAHHSTAPVVVAQHMAAGHEHHDIPQNTASTRTMSAVQRFTSMDRTVRARLPTITCPPNAAVYALSWLA